MVDLISILWILADFAVIGVFIIYRLRGRLPEILDDLCEWGKTKKKRENNLVFRLTHVPNSYFTHFYMFGLLVNVFFLWDVVLRSFFYKQLSQTIYYIRLFGLSSESISDTTCLSVSLGLVLMTVQVSRRLLECLFVHIFTGYIHILHYFVGIGFYLLVALSVIGGASPVHNSAGEWCSGTTLGSSLHWHHIPSVLLFIWASIHQSTCHMILADLSKHTKDGNTKIYRVPHGDWFEFLSSPHYFAEILIYCSINAVMNGQSTATWGALSFVIMNLSFGAISTHNWYKEKFEDYPRNRYAILPYVY